MRHERSCRHAFDSIRDDIALGGMQIPAARVYSQWPSGAPRGLPSGQGETVVKQLGQRGFCKRLGQGRRRRRRKHYRVQGIVSRRRRLGQVQQRFHLRTLVASEGIGLISPVEPVRPPSITLQMVLGRRMVIKQGGDGGVCSWSCGWRSWCSSSSCLVGRHGLGMDGAPDGKRRGDGSQAVERAKGHAKKTNNQNPPANAPRTRLSTMHSIRTYGRWLSVPGGSLNLLWCVTVYFVEFLCNEFRV